MQLARDLGNVLSSQHLKLVTAESCTGGWLAQVITSVPGSSTWFERGYVTYSNESKQELLGVLPSTIEDHGAVSEEAALAMAEGALKHSHAQISLAITGIAGPSGGSADKPVGTLWIAKAAEGRPAVAEHHLLQGDRDEIRFRAVKLALGVLLAA